jgi:hypothetical protein
MAGLWDNKLWTTLADLSGMIFQSTLNGSTKQNSRKPSAEGGRKGRKQLRSPRSASSANANSYSPYSRGKRPPAASVRSPGGSQKLELVVEPVQSEVVDGKQGPYTSSSPRRDYVPGQMGMQNFTDNRNDFHPGQPTLYGSDHFPSYDTRYQPAANPMQISPTPPSAIYNSYPLPTAEHPGSYTPNSMSQYNNGAQSWQPTGFQVGQHYGAPVANPYDGYGHTVNPSTNVDSMVPVSLHCNPSSKTTGWLNVWLQNMFTDALLLV